MKLAVVTDIHGNLEAFQAVLSDIDQNGADEIISLGDNIGYGADSEAVMAIIRERKIPSVLGNHELVVKDSKFYKWFNPKLKETLHKTFDSLSQKTISDIQVMEPVLIHRGCRFVHGFPPKSTMLYLFQMSESKILRTFQKKFDERLCFVGHTHDLNAIRVSAEAAEFLELNQGIISLDSKYRYLINPGSVGQPRDGDSQAKYMIWDTEKDSLDLRFVSYDNKTAMKKILDAGFPEFFATRLQ